MEMIGQEGRIYREGGSVVVEVPGKAYLLDIEGVICTNPDDDEMARIYRRVFRKKQVYLPHEYDRAVAEHLSGRDVLVIGANGYSRLSADQCRAYGVEVGSYETAAAKMLYEMIRSAQEQHPGVSIRLVHGASDMGIDRSLISVASKLNLNNLGFSCPKFMFYVRDDDTAVYVGESQEAYADAFVRSLDLLVAVNGREQAFKHDISAVFRHQKHLIPVNLLRVISSNGGPPAIMDDGSIGDAVALFEQRVHHVGLSIRSWQDLLDSTARTVSDMCRSNLSPERAYGYTL